MRIPRNSITDNECEMSCVHKKMQLKGRGDGQIFVCVCGHKEKLTSFQERRKKEGAGVSKKDVQKYLRQQKDEPMNNPFADALAKIKL